MNLITLDFWGIVLLAIYAGVLLLIYRLTWWLAVGTEKVIAFLTQTGLHAMAKGLLAVLIGYDEQTYHKSRFIFWNQAHVRFAFLWGAYLLIAGLLWVLHQLHVIGSVSQAWLLVFGNYIGFRCLAYWNRSKAPQILTREPTLKSLIQDVNERSPLTSRSDGQLIRRYDYLDELFSMPV